MKRGLLALAALLLTFTAHAGKPPMFKPDFPMGWTYDQKQVAERAMDVLFEKCPALSSWLPDVDSANVFVSDLSQPFNTSERQMLAPMGWKKTLTVAIFSVRKPNSPLFEGDSAVVDFYMGQGKKTGIFMQGGFFPMALCGGKPSFTFRWDGDRSFDKTEDPDAFIAAPALQFLESL